MFFSKNLASYLKSSAITEDFYNVLMCLFNSISDGTYHTLLKTNPMYQEALAELTRVEKDIESISTTPEMQTLLDRHLFSSEHIQELTNCMAYYAGIIDAYRLFKTLEIILV